MDKDLLKEWLKVTPRTKKSASAKRNQAKLARGRSAYQHRISDATHLKKRARRAAKNYLRRKLGGGGESYSKGSVHHKMRTDSIVNNQELIDIVSSRMLPDVQRADYKKLSRYSKPNKVHKIGSRKRKVFKSKKLKESFSRYISEIDETGTMLTNSKPATNKKVRKGKPNNQVIIYNKFKEEYENNTPAYKSLVKKSNKSGINVEILGEVYNRGWDAWDESMNISQSQFAFGRVNSFISGGQALEEDLDLMEIASYSRSPNKVGEIKEDIIQELSARRGNAYFNKAVKSLATSSDESTQRKRLRGIELLSKRDKKGSLTELAGYPSDGNYLHSDGRTKVTINRHRDKDGTHYVMSSHLGKFKEDHANKLAKKHGGKAVQVGENEYHVKLNEGKMSAIDYDIKSLNAGNFKQKYGKSRETVKDALTSKIEKKKEVKEGLGINPQDGKFIWKAKKVNSQADRFRAQLDDSKEKLRQQTERHREQINVFKNQIKQKKINEEGNVQKDPSKRLVGTDELVRAFKSDTPGQDPNKKDKLLSFKESLVEVAKTVDRQPVIIPAHMDAYGNLIPAKAVLKRVNRRILHNRDNPFDGDDPVDNTKRDRE